MKILTKRARKVALPSVELLQRWIGRAPSQAGQRAADALASRAIQEAWQHIEPPTGIACAEAVRAKSVLEFLQSLDGVYTAYELRKLGFLCAWAYCILVERDSRMT